MKRAAAGITEELCEGLARSVKRTYDTPFTFACTTSTATQAVTIAMVTPSQLNAAKDFYNIFKQNVESQMLFVKFNMFCPDTLTVLSTCHGDPPVALSPCPQAPPPPPPEKCNLTLTLFRASGQVNQPVCENLGLTLNTVYGTEFLYYCASFTDTTAVIQAVDIFNSEFLINRFYHDITHKAYEFQMMVGLYSLTCSDYIQLESTCQRAERLMACARPPPPPSPKTSRAKKTTGL